MASLIPAFRTAMHDPALRGNSFIVYTWLHEHLDVVEYRPVKIVEIVTALRMRDSSVRDAVRVLIARGYLSRNKHADRVWRYRLLYSVMPTVHAKPSQTAPEVGSVSR